MLENYEYVTMDDQQLRSEEDKVQRLVVRRNSK